MKRVAVLGSTGSVGKQTLDVISHIDDLELVAMGCYGQADVLLDQAKQYPQAELLLTRGTLPAGQKGYCGQDAYLCYAQDGDYDVLVVACGSIAGLAPTLAALQRGKRVALANKETLVVGAHLVRAALARGGELLPIDSEHCAIHQCLRAGQSNEVAEVILTASGGALRDLPVDKLFTATPAMVLAHPTWNMGAKITVDCATMVNKGYEVLEAMALFDLPLDKVNALLHPQSVVHSMVRFVDNSTIAQLAVGDMRLPIQYALLYPDRIPSLVSTPDWTASELSFGAIDATRYPAYELVRSVAYDQAKRIAFNAVDEVAVQSFLDGHIPYGRIHTMIQDTISHFGGDVVDLPGVYQCHSDAIRVAKEML